MPLLAHACGLPGNKQIWNATLLVKAINDFTHTNVVTVVANYKKNSNYFGQTTPKCTEIEYTTFTAGKRHRI